MTINFFPVILAPQGRESNIPTPPLAAEKARMRRYLNTAAAKPPVIRRGFYIPVILATAGIHRRDSGDIIAVAIIAAFLLFARSANRIA